MRMSNSVLDLKPEEREKIAKEVLNELRKIKCECTVDDCPFRLRCCLCIRNHRADGTLPACCLPKIPERNNVSRYPDCRTPLLWFLITPEEFKEMYNKLSNELKEKIKHNLYRLFFTVREL